MVSKNLTNIFKQGSRTYFYSSWFFPKDIRENVTRLYAFVRVADNYVDQVPQNIAEFHDFCRLFNLAWQGQPANNQVIDEFVMIAKDYKFDKQLIDDFLEAMEADTKKNVYYNLEETKKYIYGSAEVIGLMMAKIMKLPEESWLGARQLGRAMQYINFIRDLAEDIQLGRQYLPVDDMKSLGLTSLNKETTYQKPVEFIQFINNQLTIYQNWQQEAMLAFKFLPIRYRIPIQTAAVMYDYTAQVISRDPFIVFEKKVKPAIWRIILSGLEQTIKIIWNKYLVITKN